MLFISSYGVVCLALQPQQLLVSLKWYPSNCIQMGYLVNHIGSGGKQKTPAINKGFSECREKDSNLHITRILVPKTSVSTNSTTPADDNQGGKFKRILLKKKTEVYLIVIVWKLNLSKIIALKLYLKLVLPPKYTFNCIMVR